MVGFSKLMRRSLFLGGSATLFATGWYYRPLKDPMKGKGDNWDRFEINKSDCISEKTAYDYATTSEPFLLDLAKRITLLIGVSFSRFYTFQGGKFNILQDERYRQFVDKMINRDRDRAIITISNHRCFLDDPAVLASILPYWYSIQPKYIRNSLCAQDHCYSDKLPEIIHGIVGLGQVYPIWRGGGLNQKLLKDYAKFITGGKWCHICPEGGIWQNDELGGRSNGRESEIGKLKWGVGKLIAHSPKPPVVIAFYFSGTDRIIPIDMRTRKIPSMVPALGHDITVRFSYEINFDDLIAQHEQKFGKLWKYGDERDLWVTREEDLVLYSAITRRIEEVLTDINNESNRAQQK